MNASFIHNFELQRKLDDFIAIEISKNTYFPFDAPFAGVEKSDETIDPFLLCDTFEIRASLMRYYEDLISFGINKLFTRVNCSLKSFFELLSMICKHISQNANKPFYLQNSIIDLLNELDKYPGFGQVYQLLILQGVLKWLELCNLNENDKGFFEAKTLCDFVADKFFHVCIYYFTFFDKNENSKPLDDYLSTIKIYQLIVSKMTVDENTFSDSRNSNMPSNQSIHSETNEQFDYIFKSFIPKYIDEEYRSELKHVLSYGKVDKKRINWKTGHPELHKYLKTLFDDETIPHLHSDNWIDFALNNFTMKGKPISKKSLQNENTRKDW